MNPLDFREPFELRVHAVEADIDALGHVNNTVYLRWVQEVTVAHWVHLAPSDLQAEIVWMVLRHEIDYKSGAKVGDEIILKTWVGLAEGLRFDRHTEIMSSERKMLAVAKTVWCPIDTSTGRPKKLTADVRRLFTGD